MPACSPLLNTTQQNLHIMSKEKLTFGPPGDEWTYDKRTKTYDLTRGASSSSSSPPLKIALTQGVPGATLLVDPSRTALVVVDMQNFFLHPSCRSHPAGLAAVAPLLATVAGCRAAGVRVVWLNWGLTDADLDGSGGGGGGLPAGVAHGFARGVVTGERERAGLGVDLGGGRGRCLVAGEWNSEIYGPLVEAGAVWEGTDVRCAKNRMSGLWAESQPLWRYLSEEEEEEEAAVVGEEGEGGKRGRGKRKKKTTTLLFAGVNTDQCVLGTLADAYNAGWDCVMVEDCCATTTEGAREVCLSNVSVSGCFCLLDVDIDDGEVE